MSIRHLCGSIYRNHLKFKFSFTHYVEIGRFGDIIISFAPASYVCAFIHCSSAHFAVAKPERNIYAFYLFDMVMFFECLRKEDFAFVVIFKSLYRLVFVQLERNYKVRFKSAGELSGNNRRVSAIGTACCGCCCIADKFRAAGRTAIGFHAFSLFFAPFHSHSFKLGFFFFLFFFVYRKAFFCFRNVLCIEFFDFLNGIFASAVITFKHSAFSDIMQWSGTCGTLMVRYIYCHFFASPYI